MNTLDLLRLLVPAAGLIAAFSVPNGPCRAAYPSPSTVGKSASSPGQPAAAMPPSVASPPHMTRDAVQGSHDAPKESVPWTENVVLPDRLVAEYVAAAASYLAHENLLTHLWESGPEPTGLYNDKLLYFWAQRGRTGPVYVTYGEWSLDEWQQVKRGNIQLAEEMHRRKMNIAYAARRGVTVFGTRLGTAVVGSEDHFRHDKGHDVQIAHPVLAAIRPIPLPSLPCRRPGKPPEFVRYYFPAIAIAVSAHLRNAYGYVGDFDVYLEPTDRWAPELHCLVDGPVHRVLTLNFWRLDRALRESCAGIPEPRSWEEVHEPDLSQPLAPQSVRSLNAMEALINRHGHHTANSYDIADTPDNFGSRPWDHFTARRWTDPDQDRYDPRKPLPKTGVVARYASYLKKCGWPYRYSAARRKKQRRQGTFRWPKNPDEER